MLNRTEANILRLAGRMTVIEAIAWQEGFWEGPHTSAARNHNPGNLEIGKFVRAHGSVGIDRVYAIFPDDITGFNAMQALLQGHYRGYTFRKIIEVWAPPKENDTEVYITNVCRWTSFKETDIINDFPMDQISMGAQPGGAAVAFGIPAISSVHS